MELPGLLREILAKRGIVTDEDLEKFLNPSIGYLAKPEELPGIDLAVQAVMAAHAAGRRIVVFGDYDCDGVCATAIMVLALRALGCKVDPFLPERIEEGYGMSERAVARMLDTFPEIGLVITVDNGINSVDRVDELKRRGIAVVVTDHHLPGETLPDCPVVNPKVDAPAHLQDLCGAAVAFLFANALVSRARADGSYDGGKIAGELLILAGLATITDIMPLIGQNRILVAESMKRFYRLAPVGLQELYQRGARTGTATFSSRDFAFVLGPRINAAGRMASGTEALNLILARDREVARAAAMLVDERNMQRKSAEREMIEAAETQLRPGASAQVIHIESGNQGVSGIVAARMLERLENGGVPVCVVVECRGSARAPDGYNVRDAFAECAEFLDDYGGHSAAGGCNVKPGMIDAFSARFCEVCARQRAAMEAKGVRVGELKSDAVISASDVTLQLAESLHLLEPFGEGNRDPVFEIKNVYIIEVRPAGSDGRHLALSVRSGQERLRAVWWNAGSRVEEFRAASGFHFDAFFNIAVSDFQEPHPELRIVDLKPVQ